jgi:hypothetical protein
MEKILLIINAQQPNMASVHFACQIAKMASTRITGLFIENLFFDPRKGKSLDQSYLSVNVDAPATVLADTDQSIRIFKDTCAKHRVITEVYVDQGEPIQEIVFESRYTDLLIIDPYICFYGRDEEIPSDFLKEVLQHSECPVLIAPEQFDNVEEIIFCYDGNASSVHAIKQFTELSACKVMVVEVDRQGQNEFDEAHRRLLAWLRSHYTDVYYQILKGDVKDELFTYLFMKQKKFVVMGAYGRSALSNLFKKSNADQVIKAIDLPLFICHPLNPRP